MIQFYFSFSKVNKQYYDVKVEPFMNQIGIKGRFQALCSSFRQHDSWKNVFVS